VFPLPRRAIPVRGGAISTGKGSARSPDAKLLRLEAEFNAANDRESKAGAKVDALDAKIDGLRARRDKTEEKQQRWTDEVARLLEKVMATRAKSLEGMLVKARVRERYNCDDEAREGMILDSIVKDLKRMARGPKPRSSPPR
jgi:chromosome segregation ATPase